MTRDIGVQQ